MSTRTNVIPLNHPQPFNDKAHVIVAEIFDENERRLVRQGRCQPHEAMDYLTVAFIKESGEFLNHGTCYLENEGRIAADLFLWYLPKTKVKARYLRNDRICALQLHWHTHYYFHRYHPLLRQATLKLLANLPDIAAIDRNGVLHLAARTLPGVRTDINRERRRRGAESDRLIVPNDELERSLNRLCAILN